MKQEDVLWSQSDRKNRWISYLVKAALILLLLFILFRIFVHLRPKTVTDTERGLQQLEALQETDVETAEKTIRDRRKQWADKKLEDAEKEKKEEEGEDGETSEDGEDSENSGDASAADGTSETGEEDSSAEYDESYDENYDESYDENYDESYDESYDENYDSSYDGEEESW